MVYIVKKEELYHYGVKGMKWGVRHDKPPSGKKSKRQGLTNTQKKILLAGAATIGVSAAFYLAYRYGAVHSINRALQNNQASSKLIKKIMTERLKSTSVTLKKGTEIHRSVNDLSSKSLNGAQYTTYLKDDYRVYRSNFGHNTKDSYDVVFKATEKIKAPSFNKANKIFDKFIKENPEFKKELRETLISTRMNYSHNPMSYKDAAKRVDREMSENLFKAANYSLVNKNANTTSTLINLYKRKGYNAIEDYIDKGVNSKSPLIIFDMNKSTVKTGQTYMTNYLKNLDKKKLRYANEVFKYDVFN